MPVSVEYFVAPRSPPQTGHSAPACAFAVPAANAAITINRNSMRLMVAACERCVYRPFALGNPFSISRAERRDNAQKVSVAFAQLPLTHVGAPTTKRFS